MRVVALRFVAGIALLAIGFLILAIGVVAFIDPVGTKMADDGDPFGPASRAGAVLPMLLGTASVFFGWRLARRKSAD